MKCLWLARPTQLFTCGATPVVRTLRSLACRPPIAATTHPWAMVVHLDDASFTNGAVVRAARLERVAPVARLNAVTVQCQRLRTGRAGSTPARYLPCFALQRQRLERHRARVREHRPQVRHEHQHLCPNHQHLCLPTPQRPRSGRQQIGCADQRGIPQRANQIRSNVLTSAYRKAAVHESVHNPADRNGEPGCHNEK